MSQALRSLSIVALEVATVAYGRPAVDLLADQVAKVKGAESLAPVTVVVPSNYAGVAVRRALAASGGVAAVTFLTIHRLAERLGAARLAAADRRPVSAPVTAAAVRGVLATDPGVFEPVADHPATEEALAGAHRQLLEVSERGLDQLAAQSARAKDVVRIHRAVRAALARHWYDEHDLMLAAAEAVECDATGAVPGPLGPVVVHLPQEMVPAAARLLRRLAAHVPVLVNVGLTGDSRADRYVRRSLEQLVGHDRFPPSPVPERPVARRIVSTSDPDEEVRAAIRLLVDAMRAGTPLARTAVLYASREPYARLAREHLEAAGIPWNGHQVHTVGEALAGRTLRGLLALPERNLRRGDVMALLTSCPIVGADGHPVPVTAWERITREAGVVDGEDWQRRLGLFAEETSALAADAEAEGKEGKGRHLRAEANRAQSLRAFLGRLVQDLHGAGHTATWARRAGWATEMLDRYLGAAERREAWPEEERRAAEWVEAALDRLAGLDALGGPPSSLEVFRRSLESELNTSLRRVGRFGEGVLVGHLSLAVGLDLDLVIVLGLAEGTLPARRLEDSLLHDEERLTTEGELRARGELADDDHLHLLAAVATGREAVLCFPRGDLRRPGERTASRWLLADAAALSGAGTVFTNHLSGLRHHDWLDDVPSYAGGIARLSRPATEQEYNLRSLLDASGPLHQHPTVMRDEVIAAGVAMATARQSARFTRFDGNLRGLGLPDLTAQGSVTSPTRLETWASCPHRYLLEHLLQVKVPQDPERALIMSPLDRGSLVHEVLERFLAETIRDGGPEGAWTAEERDRLRDIAEEVCDRYENRGLTGRSVFWRRDRTLLLADLERFLDEDDRRRARLRTRPIATELRFGLPGWGAEAVRFPLPDGRSVGFRGSADRVDRAADGTLFVTDYKTGRASKYKGLSADDPHQRGTRLQLPVYATAARTSHGTPATRVHAGYWFVTDKGGFDWIGYELTSAVETEVGGVLATIADGISAGVFPAHPPPQRSYGGYRECDYCDPDGLGAGDRRREWDRKRADPALAPYVALAEPDHAEEGHGGARRQGGSRRRRGLR
jgi:ATP-dependent helicase/nuclease subunit B